MIKGLQPSRLPSRHRLAARQRPDRRGLRRYGFDEAARRIFLGILEAASHFPHLRLPELFAGFARRDVDVPVPYPVACHPQAWAAGAVPHLGLQPQAFERRLRIIRPTLPDLVDRLEVRGLRVGEARADLRFTRLRDGTVDVEVPSIEGELAVSVEEAEAVGAR